MKVLIADDNEMNLKVLHVTLEAEGLEVRDASNGVEALAILEREPVDAIVSDILMPKMDGYRLCYEVRKDARWRELPFIIYTATYTSPSDENLSSQMGADLYLKKPTSANEIAQALRTLVADKNRRAPQPPPATTEVDVLKEYSERLVTKLEHKNIELDSANAKLSASQARLSNILATAMDAIVTIDENQNIVLFNQAAESMFGWRAEDMLGQPLERLIPTRLRETHRRQVETFAASGVTNRKMGNLNPLIGLRADGREFPVEASIAQSEVNGEKIFTVIVRDITERQRAEAELRESEERFSKAFHSSPAAMSLTDVTTGRYVEANESYCELVGYTRAELIGHTTSELGLISVAARERYVNVLREQGHLYVAEYEMTNHRGEKKWIAVTTEMISLKGAPVVLAGVFDLTERKKAEEELRLASEILQRVKSLVVVADAEGKVQYVGPSSKEILGYASDELLGEEWWNKTQTDLAERERQKSYVVRAARGDGPILLEPYERTLVSQDGETHWIVWQDAHGPGKTLIGVGHDITDRKRAEEIIRKNEKRFRALIENSSDVTAIIAPDAVIHYISPSITRIFGYPEDELVGHNAFDFIHPDDHEHVMQRLLELLRDPIQNAPVEFRALRKDGAWLHTEAIASNQLDEPSIRGVIINYRDISERKRAEERVAASEKRFRALIENSADAISMIDRQGKILYVSPAVQRIFGYAPDDPSSIQNLSDVIHPDDLPMFGQVMAQLLQAPGAAVNATLRERTRDGRWLWVEGTATNLLDEPSVQAIVINFRDVTERKQAELALAQSEERYRLVTELASDYAYAYRLDEPGKAVLEWVTDAYERITGYTLAEVNETGAWQKLVHPDDLPIAYAHTERLNAGEASEVEYRILTKQGETRWLRDLMRPLEDETTGRVVRVYGAAQDITERKRAEEQIRHQLGQLGSLRVIDNAISNSLDLRVTMEVFLQQVTEQLKVDAAEVMLFNQTSQVIEATARRGFRRRALENTRIRLGQGIVGRAVLERELIQIPDLALEQSQLVRQWLVTEEGFASYFAAPLIAKGQVKGVLNVYHRVPREVNSDWLDFFIALAGQAAIAIDNAQLFENLQRSNFELGLAYDTTLEGWSRALDLRDKETEGHTQRVTELTLKLAARMGMSKEDLAEVRRGALLHDIGKMGVPDSVLLKPDKLSEEEWVVMRKHPVYAFELLAPIKYLAHALDIPYCHHEKWDGTGYPRGLKGEQIPLAARLFAIVDVWDAIRSDRPYRKAWSTDEAREHILALSGTHFDPRVVQVFLQMIATAPDGTSPLA